MPTSLVTGGGGFIGSHLVDALLARGDVVRVLDNFSTGKRENLQHNIEKIQLLTGDLRDSEVLREAVQGVDFIFHQAAFVSVPQSMEDPDSCFDINVNGTGKLLAAARMAGVKRVVLASSAAVYGENEAVPLSEDEEPDPLSPYAASKSINEIYARLFTKHLGLNVVALRYFNVYGPRQNPASDYAAVVPIFIKILEDEGEPVIFGDGLQTRDFVYIADVVQANMSLSRHQVKYSISVQAKRSACWICSKSCHPSITGKFCPHSRKPDRGTSIVPWVIPIRLGIFSSFRLPPVLLMGWMKQLPG